MTDSFEDMGNAYTAEVFQYERDNPRVHIGQVVRLYNWDNPENPVYCGMGLVKKLTWDAAFMQYVVDCDFFYNDSIKNFVVFASECEPVRGNVRLRCVK